MPIEFNFICQSCHGGSELQNLKIGILKKTFKTILRLGFAISASATCEQNSEKALKDAWFNITILAFCMFLVLMAVSSATTTSTLVADATLYLLPPPFITDFLHLLTLGRGTDHGRSSEMYQINFFTT